MTRKRSEQFAVYGANNASPIHTGSLSSCLDFIRHYARETNTLTLVNRELSR